MAVPSFQGLGNAAGSTAGFGTLTWPAHIAGDIALLMIETAGSQPITLTTPSGFVAVSNSPQATGTGTNGTQLAVFWCRATSTSMANPVLGDSGDHQFGRIITFRNCIGTGDPWDVTAGSVKAVATTSASAPSVTTTVDNCLIVNFISHDIDTGSGIQLSGWANSNLSSYTEISQAASSQGNGGGVGVACGMLSTHGASGVSTATIATSSTNASITIALKPDPSSSTGDVKVWNGSSFVAKPIKVWNGSTWVTKPLKRWNGTAWVATNY